jgi:regulator of protease activity HflC (stomatin/prohibitin superfamily)
MSKELIIKDTHRALLYEDGVLVKVLGAGRHELKEPLPLPFMPRRPKVEVVMVDVRERELTIKGQEILTSDKVAIRVSIIVQFKVSDPKAAIHQVVNYEERLYSDVQLAARRSLASMSLEEILTNRNRLSEDIMRDVKEAAGGYGVTILRADVKDLVFPGNLQEIMNKVLTAERLSQAKLVETRTEMEKRRLEVANEAEVQTMQAEAEAKASRARAEALAEAERIAADGEAASMTARESLAKFYAQYPGMLRLKELEAMAELGRTASARLFVGFDNMPSTAPE